MATGKFKHEGIQNNNYCLWIENIIKNAGISSSPNRCVAQHLFKSTFLTF